MTPTAPAGDRIAYSLQEAAEACSLGYEQIRRAVASGDLKAKRRGRRLLVSRKALEAWFAGLDDA